MNGLPCIQDTVSVVVLGQAVAERNVEQIFEENPSQSVLPSSSHAADYRPG